MCGLCGLGERGGEHLAHWCPAVGRAWVRLSGLGLSVAAALLACAFASSDEDICNDLSDSLYQMNMSLPGCAMEAGVDGSECFIDHLVSIKEKNH